MTRTPAAAALRRYAYIVTAAFVFTESHVRRGFHNHFHYLHASPHFASSDATLGSSSCIRRFFLAPAAEYSAISLVGLLSHFSYISNRGLLRSLDLARITVTIRILIAEYIAIVKHSPFRKEYTLFGKDSSLPGAKIFRSFYILRMFQSLLPIMRKILRSRRQIFIVLGVLYRARV